MNAAVTKFRVKTFAAIMLVGLIPAISQAEPMTRDAGIATGTGATIGAIAGGPLGFVVGTMVGAIIGENVDKTNELNNAELAMDNAIEEIDLLEQQIFQMDLAIGNMESDVVQLEEALLTRLEFQVLFRTGDDRLREADRERIAMLAKYMQRNADVKVRLQGHADARGTEEYNNVLAQYRARSVSDALVELGVATDRIVVESLGAKKASAKPGDYEGYALDRHVNIEVVSKNLVKASNEESSEGLALVQ